MHMNVKKSNSIDEIRDLVGNLRVELSSLFFCLLGLNHFS